MDLNWSALIERAKSNDQEAFYSLYQNSYDAVYRTVRSMVRDEDAVLDIVQDSFIKGFGSLSSLDDPEKFTPWMKRIASNKAKDWFKKRHDISFSQLADDEGNEPDFADERTEHSPEAVIDRNETTRLIEEILGGLPDEQRIVVGMYYYQDMSVAEIAQELEVSENTVKSRLNYGRKKIRAGVEELEKKGTKLYGLAPIPFLIWLFRNQIANPSMGVAPAATFGSVMSQVAAQGTAATAGSAITAEGTAAAAAGKAGLLSTLGGKIAAAAVAVAVIGGGIGAGVYFATRDYEDVPAIVETEPDTSTERTEPTESVTEEEPVEDPVDDTQGHVHSYTQVAGGHSEIGDSISWATAIYECTECGKKYSDITYENLDISSSEDLLTEFLEERLISITKIYSIEQTTYDIGSGFFNRVDYTYDPATGKLTPTYTDLMGVEGAYAEYETAKENADINGMYCADIYDYDGDGELELFTVYGEYGSLYMELFDTEGSRVVSKGKIAFDEIEYENDNKFIYRFDTKDGKVAVALLDYQHLSGAGVDCIYYHLSDRLEIISLMNINYPDDSFTEVFYDGRPEQTFEVDWDFNYDQYFPYFEDYSGNEELLLEIREVWPEINDFMLKYYKG